MKIGFAGIVPLPYTTRQLLDLLEAEQPAILPTPVPTLPPVTMAIQEVPRALIQTSNQLAPMLQVNEEEEGMVYLSMDTPTKMMEEGASGSVSRKRKA
jgi:hypothetical protein